MSELRKAASAIYLACEEVVATDVSRILTNAAYEIDRLTAENTTLECLNSDYAAKIATLKDTLRETGIALRNAIESIQAHKAEIATKQEQWDCYASEWQSEDNRLNNLVVKLEAEIATLENAEWLTTAHLLCSDMGVANGHINDRMVALRDKLAQYAGGVEVEGIVFSVLRNADYVENINISIPPTVIDNIVGQPVTVLVRAKG